jgi:hypothetical protein
MKDKAPLPLTVGQFRKVLPLLHLALLRRRFQPLLNKEMLKVFGESELPFFKLVAAACTPPQSELDEHLMLLSDLAAGLLFKEEFSLSQKVEELLSRALPEVEEAYNAAKMAPGGWSSVKGKAESRQEAVLKWFQENQDRLRVLEKRHLQDWTLYLDSEQEKRAFQGKLLKNVIESSYEWEIPEMDINAYLKRMRQSKKWLEKIMAGEAAP